MTLRDELDSFYIKRWTWIIWESEYWEAEYWHLYPILPQRIHLLTGEVRWKEVPHCGLDMEGCISFLCSSFYILFLATLLSIFPLSRPIHHTLSAFKSPKHTLNVLDMWEKANLFCFPLWISGIVSQWWERVYNNEKSSVTWGRRTSSCFLKEKRLKSQRKHSWSK